MQKTQASPYLSQVRQTASLKGLPQKSALSLSPAALAAGLKQHWQYTQCDDCHIAHVYAIDSEHLPSPMLGGLETPGQAPQATCIKVLRVYHPRLVVKP